MFFVLVGRIELRSQRIVIWDLGGQEDLQTLWDKVLLYNINIMIIHSLNECCIYYLYVCISCIGTGGKCTWIYVIYYNFIVAQIDSM